MFQKQVCMAAVLFVLLLVLGCFINCAPYGGNYNSSPTVTTCADARAELAYAQQQLANAQANAENVNKLQPRNKNERNLAAGAAFLGGFNIGMYQQRVANAQAMVARLCY